MSLFTTNTTTLNLTPEEKTLYSKLRTGQRCSGVYIISTLEHHSEQGIFRSLLSKMQDASPFKDKKAMKTWIASTLKTQTVEIDRFEKKYPRMIETTIPVEPERLAILEARVAHLESELRRVYDLQEDVRRLEDRQNRYSSRERRSSDRPRSPAYSPYAPPSTPPVFGSHNDSCKW